MMCNINVVFKKAGQDVVQQISDMTAISFSSNSDGEGAFFSCDGTVVRQPEKRIDVKAYADKIKASEVVIFHERLATHGGKTIESTHPFFNERFVMVHNGIFWSAGGWEVWKNKSDSARFFDNFCDAFASKKDIKKAIEAALKKTGSGTYSIMLYDKQEKAGYYFKDRGTDMNAFYAKNGCVVFTTNSKNDIFWDIDTTKTIDPSFDVLLKIKKSGNAYVVEEMGDLDTGAWVDFNYGYNHGCGECAPAANPKYNYKPKVSTSSYHKSKAYHYERNYYGESDGGFWPEYDTSTFKAFWNFFGIMAYFCVLMITAPLMGAADLIVWGLEAAINYGVRNDNRPSEPAIPKGGSPPVVGTAVSQQRS